MRRLQSLLFLLALCGLGSEAAFATTAELYTPPWAAELGWAASMLKNDNVYHAPVGALAYLENQSVPWWKAQVAHPIDYDSSKLPVGSVRVDGALDVEYTIHRALRGWAVQSSPTGINNVYTYTPGSTAQQDRTGRSGQSAFFDFGFHPIASLMGDVGIEAVGNYDQRYWFPLNEEHRMFKDDRHVKLARAEFKYDNETFMIRGFEAIPNLPWVYQNDLFQMMPSQLDVERYRRAEGTLTPRGGEMRYKSPLGTLDVIGGSEMVWGFGPSAYAKYDAPAMGSWENSVVYRNDKIPFSLDPDERRWAVSYNASWLLTESISSHAGVIYQPFRLNTPYTDVTTVAAGQGIGGSTFDVRHKRTLTRDAMGATWRIEARPESIVDRAGLGYTYLGAVAGNKQQVDVDASRSFQKLWTLSGAYIYRRPLIEAVPLLYEGTSSAPGALVANPRGPDDPFWVDWDNRQAHVASLTLVYDSTPDTYFFRYNKNVLDSWNFNPEEDAPWLVAVQYRATYYPTNTDRMYYWNEDRSLNFDPIFHTGALATSYPFSSATGVVRWTRDRWHVTADLSGGQALAGNAIAYTSATNYYKPSTTYVQGGVEVDDSVFKGWVRYGRDVWGPQDYHPQLGWAYHHIYQAGLSYIFLRDFESGFRYVGTRMTDQFIGPDTGAFNEYRFFLTYHFGKIVSLGKKSAPQGRPAQISKPAPQVALTAADPQFTPDGSGPKRTLTLMTQATAPAGVASWQVSIRDAQNAVVKQWEGTGEPPASLEWNGLAADARPLATGTYQAAMDVTDRDKQSGTAALPGILIQSLTPVTPKLYTTQETDEGLKVTLSSKVLFTTGRADLKAGSKTALSQIIELLHAYPKNTLRIAGHTDSVGSVTSNQKLSEQRAQSVADYLAKTGAIDRKRMKVVGLSEKSPIATNATEEGRALNRRVEIDILK